MSCLADFGGDPEAAGATRPISTGPTASSCPGTSAWAFFANPPAPSHGDVSGRTAGAAGRLPPGPFPEDYELWLRWSEAGVAMAKLPEALVVWNDPPGRLSRTDPRYDPEAFHR